MTRVNQIKSGKKDTTYIKHVQVPGQNRFRQKRVKDIENVFRLKRKYGVHADTPEFRRYVMSISDRNGQNQKPVHICQYYFHGDNPVDVQMSVHGNLEQKSRTPFRTTQTSTRGHIKEECINEKPRIIYQKLHLEAGGAVNFKTVSEEARNKQQIYNLKRNVKEQSTCNTGDELYDLLTLASEDNRQEEEFVRELTMTRQPMVKLFTNQQLHDLVRYCAFSENFTPACIDGTFNTSDWFLTLFSFKNLSVCHKGTNNHPLCIGPSFLHKHRGFPEYLNFFKTLQEHNTEVANIKAIGTDGELALINALLTTLNKKVIHLRCKTHDRNNIKQKLMDLGYPLHMRMEILKDIYGFTEGNIFHSGLYDAEDEKDFKEKLLVCKERWAQLEKKHNNQVSGTFFKYFEKEKAEVFIGHMIKPVRKASNITSSNGFHQTGSEWANKIIKDDLDYKRLKAPAVLNHLKKLTQRHYDEVKKAVYGTGEYELSQDYKHFYVPYKEWQMMKNEERKDHLAKFLDFIPPVSSAVQENEVADTSLHADDVHFGENCNDDKFPLEDIQSALNHLSPFAVTEMVKKAKDLLKLPYGITPAASSAVNARTVFSSSQVAPHFVYQTDKKGKRWICDCSGYKSAKVCSHVLAVVAERGEMMLYVNAMAKSTKRKTNLSDLFDKSKPKTAGKKPRQYVNSKRKRQQLQVPVIHCEDRLSQPASLHPDPASSPQDTCTQTQCPQAHLSTGAMDNGSTKMSDIVDDHFTLLFLSMTKAQKCHGCGGLFDRGDDEYIIVRKHLLS